MNQAQHPFQPVPLTRRDRQKILIHLQWSKVVMECKGGDDNWKHDLKKMEGWIYSISRKGWRARDAIVQLKRDLDAYDARVGYKHLLRANMEQEDLLLYELEVDAACTMVLKIEREINRLAAIGGVRFEWEMRPLYRTISEGGEHPDVV